MTEFTKRPDGLIVPAGIKPARLPRRHPALGLAAGIGSSIGLGEARGAGAKRGGHLKLASTAERRTDSLDPATYSGSVSFVIGHLWGDTLVESHPRQALLPAIASSWESSGGCFGLDVQDPERHRFPRRQETHRRRRDRNVEAAFRRRLQVGSARADAVRQGDRGKSRRPRPDADGRQCGPAPPADRLSSHHPARRGVDNPTSPDRHRPYKLASYEAGIRATFEKNTADWRSGPRLCRQRRDHRHERQHGPHCGAFLRAGAFHQRRRSKTVPLLKRAPRVEILQTSGKGFYSFLIALRHGPLRQQRPEARAEICHR